MVSWRYNNAKYVKTEIDNTLRVSLTFKGVIDRVDLIPGTDNEVEIIDYKTGGEPGPGERLRQLLLYAHGFKHLYPNYTVRRLSPELLSKPKQRVYELDGARVCEFQGGAAG